MLYKHLDISFIFNLNLFDIVIDAQSMKSRVLVSIVEPVKLPYLGLNVPVVWMYLVGNVISQYPFHFISIRSNVVYSPCLVGVNNTSKHCRILCTKENYRVDTDTLQFTTVVQKLSFANHILLDFPVLRIKQIPYIISQSKKNHKLPLSHRIFHQYYTPLTL